MCNDATCVSIIELETEISYSPANLNPKVQYLGDGVMAFFGYPDRKRRTASEINSNSRATP
jgi:hypothetical protein